MKCVKELFICLKARKNVPDIKGSCDYHDDENDIGDIKSEYGKKK